MLRRSAVGVGCCDWRVDGNAAGRNLGSEQASEEEAGQDESDCFHGRRGWPELDAQV